MKITFAAEGTRVQVREDINSQARELYKADDTKPARALVASVAQEVARAIDSHDAKMGDHARVLVEVDIDVSVMTEKAFNETK